MNEAYTGQRQSKIEPSAFFFIINISHNCIFVFFFWDANGLVASGVTRKEGEKGPYETRKRADDNQFLHPFTFYKVGLLWLVD